MRFFFLLWKHGEGAQLNLLKKDNHAAYRPEIFITLILTSYKR